ncbi:MAG: hypothetical protein KIT22_16230, partial [Verrucomicrobiae bacterium]|nr:hypothetical protein [Verrucomicrobiae bacterium]
LRRALLPAVPAQGTNGTLFQSILQITDAADSLLIRVPVTARPSGGLTAGLGDAGTSHDFQGLWVGAVQLNQVNAPAYTNALLSTPAPFKARLLLHVDGNGTARLLQQVLLAWDPSLNQAPHTNGAYALFAGETSLPGNASQVKRISSAALPTMPPLVLTGGFGNQLTGTVVIPFDHPTNPFLHRYHPLHDNRDSQGKPYTNAVEVPNLGRNLSLTFSASTNASGTLQAGVDLVSGVYDETLSGLRAQPIRVQGNFALRRISQISQLQGVAP